MRAEADEDAQECKEVCKGLHNRQRRTMIINLVFHIGTFHVIPVLRAES